MIGLSSLAVCKFVFYDVGFLPLIIDKSALVVKVVSPLLPCRRRLSNTTLVTGLWNLHREDWPSHARYQDWDHG